MAGSLSWALGAGPCHFEANDRAWTGCSLNDWQTRGTTCFVESWRSVPGAELDVSAVARHSAPGSAPAVVSRVVRGKPRARKSRARNAGQQQHQQQRKDKKLLTEDSYHFEIAFGGPVSLDPHLSSPPSLPLPLPLPSFPKGYASSALEKDKASAAVQAGSGGALASAKASSLEPKIHSGGALQFDFVVVGSGIAGLRFALDISKHGSVAVVTKSDCQEGSTNYAQGGVSAVLGPGDSVESHIRDTMVAGVYLNDEEVVEVVCREGPERVRELMAMGASFDKGEDGALQLAREGGHSYNRIVHAADVTGREIQRALLVAARKCPSITLFEHHFVVDLITDQNQDDIPTCFGVDALDVRTGRVERFLAASTLLASGGAGHVYPNTTNPTVATGDGIALGQRCQAVVSNMEFVQFHPTALADAGLPHPPPTPRPNAFLITEAVRGAGGILYNQSGERFMLHYDPRAELAPRDVVARSIDDQLKKRGEEFVWLDISHRPAEEILVHFPNIAEECSRCGIDITKQPIPVVPAAHYMCGGVQTGLHGETSVRGLWAAGEVACTGLHGANRLASNSLLEALVFAQRAVGPAVEHVLRQREGAGKGTKMTAEILAGFELEGTTAVGPGTRVKEGASAETRKMLPNSPPPSLEDIPRAVGLPAKDPRAAKAAQVTAKYRRQLQQTMWDYVGIVRSTERLIIAQGILSALAEDWEEALEAQAQLPRGTVTVEVCEMRNLLSVSMLIVRSALQRHESRGLHFTTDFPDSLESERLPTVLDPEGITALWQQATSDSCTVPRHAQSVLVENLTSRSLLSTKLHQTALTPSFLRE